MRLGILIVDSKVVLGPVKYGEAEAAYKERIRTGVPGVVEVWASDQSKKAKLKGDSELAANGKPEPAAKGKK